MSDPRPDYDPTEDAESQSLDQLVARITHLEQLLIPRTVRQNRDKKTGEPLPIQKCRFTAVDDLMTRVEINEDNISDLESDIREVSDRVETKACDIKEEVQKQVKKILKEALNV